MTTLGIEDEGSEVSEPSCGDGAVEVTEGSVDEDSVLGKVVEDEDVDESDDSAVVVDDVDEDDEEVVESSLESTPPC